MPAIGEIYYHLSEGSSQGHKTAVVLIHGAGGTHLYWPAEIRRLTGYRVLAPDLPGHGKSAGRGRQSVGEYGEALLEWLSALGIHSAVMIGHSLGSAIALTLALDHPENVSALVLVGGGARLKVASQLMGLAENPTTYLTAVRTVVEWSFGPSAPPRMKELAEQRMAETRSSVLYNDFRACSEFDETDRVCQVRQPTLIVCGREDRMTPVRHSQYIAEQIPAAELKIIADSGHMVQLEKPSELADALQSFLSGIKYL